MSSSFIETIVNKETNLILNPEDTGSIGSIVTKDNLLTRSSERMSIVKTEYKESEKKHRYDITMNLFELLHSYKYTFKHTVKMIESILPRVYDITTFPLLKTVLETIETDYLKILFKNCLKLIIDSTWIAEDWDSAYLNPEHSLSNQRILIYQICQLIIESKKEETISIFLSVANSFLTIKGQRIEIDYDNEFQSYPVQHSRIIYQPDHNYNKKIIDFTNEIIKCIVQYILSESSVFLLIPELSNIVKEYATLVYEYMPESQITEDIRDFVDINDFVDISDFVLSAWAVKPSKTSGFS
jgi:hypothetical protein